MSRYETITKTTERTVDPDTGIVNEKVTDTDVAVSSNKCTEPKFVKLYVQNWLNFQAAVKEDNKINNNCADLLLAMCESMTYANDVTGGKQIVQMTKYLKDRIGERLGYKPNTIRNMLNNLVRVGAVKRIAQAVYQINPSLIGLGDWKDIKKLKIEAKFDYTEKKIFSNVETVEETEPEEDVSEQPDITEEDQEPQIEGQTSVLDYPQTIPRAASSSQKRSMNV